MERCGAQVVSFVVSIVLARILEPELYGTIALITVITSILQVFVDSGMANALIQKKDTDDLDYSSVFYFNVAFCLVLYIGLFFASPLISRIYGSPDLVPVIRVLGLTIVVSGVKNVQQAYVAKTMQFRRFFFSTPRRYAVLRRRRHHDGLPRLRDMGAGRSAASERRCQYRDPLADRRLEAEAHVLLQRLGGLVSYGWKLLVSALLDTIYLKISQLVVGLKYTSSDLAFYNKGDQLCLLVVENINSSIDSVLLPVLSAEQDSRDHVREMTSRAIKTSSYIMMPLMMGMAVCAEPLIRLLLTEKWLPCVPYMQVFCAMYAFYPLHTANLNAIKAMGHSDIFLKLEIIKGDRRHRSYLRRDEHQRLCRRRQSVRLRAHFLVINAWPNRKLLGYKLTKQLRDILPALLLACLMGVCIYPISLLGLSDWLTLLIQVPLGIAIYVGGSVIFRVDSFSFMLDVLRRLTGRAAEE